MKTFYFIFFVFFSLNQQEFIQILSYAIFHLISLKFYIFSSRKKGDKTVLLLLFHVRAVFSFFSYTEGKEG